MGRRGPKPNIAGKFPVCESTPQPPGWLQGEAMKKWNEAVTKLTEIGTIGAVDSTALTRYCQQWAQWVDCQAILAMEGMTMTFEMEGQGTITKPRPEFAIAEKLATQMKKFEDSMGMNASSRHGMKVTPKKKVTNPLEELRAALKSG